MSDQSGSTVSERISCIIKIINIASGAIMIGFGIGGIIFMAINQLLNAKFFLVFSPIFMILFGLILLSAEFKLEFVTSRLIFLNSLVGRGIFNIYLSSSVYYYFACGTTGAQWAGWLSASLMFAIGVTYLILFCMGKKNSQQQTKYQVV